VACDYIKEFAKIANYIMEIYVYTRIYLTFMAHCAERSFVMKLDQNKIRKYRSRRILSVVLAVVIKILMFAVPASILVFSNVFGAWTEVALGVLFALYIAFDSVQDDSGWTRLSTLAIVFVLVIILLIDAFTPSWIVELVTGLLYILYVLAYFFVPNYRF
jgi:hypothetical protein